MSIRASVVELRAGAGTQFDPDVIDALVVEVFGSAQADARIA
jgi:hypothetical protein